MFSLNIYTALFVDSLLIICVKQNVITHMIFLDRLRHINSINLVSFQMPRVMLYIDAFIMFFLLHQFPKKLSEFSCVENSDFSVD